MKRHALRTGEYLAIDPGVIHHDADGFFILLGGDPPENERKGTVCIVHVRGALTQFRGEGGDSYEAIVERVQAGLNADPKPSVILFRHSSPGGVVAGLNETVFKLQRMSKAAGVPFVSFVGEIAASADYALCCASGWVLCPPSGICGSIGVISTMVSASEADKKMGIAYRIITSGKRKADGHLHAPIDEDAVKAETGRNKQLADQFFNLAGKARKMKPAALAALEASIYLGKDAERIGLVDEVISLDEAIYGLDQSETAPPESVAPNTGNATDRRAKEDLEATVSGLGDESVAPALDKLNRSGSHSPVTSNVTPPHGAVAMPVKLDALIKRTEAAITSETDPKKRVALQARLAAYAVAKADSDGDDDGPPEKKDGDDDEGDDEAAKHAENSRKMKAKSKAMGHRARAADFKKKAAESEEEAKKCEEEAKGGSEEGDEEESEAALALPDTSGVVDPTVLALVQAVSALTADNKDAKERSQKAERADLMSRASRYIPKHILAPIAATANLATLRAMVTEAEKGQPMVSTEEGDLVRAKHVDPETEAALPAATIAIIDEAVTNCGAKDPKAFRAALVTAHLAASKAGTNGVRGKGAY